MAKMNYTITLNRKKGFEGFGNKERTNLMFDHKDAGVNRDYTENKVIPIILKRLGYEDCSFKLGGFRYYLGTYIYQLTIYAKNEVVTGHIVSTWLGGEVIEID